MMQYEDTIDEVLSQYPLTDRQRVCIKRQIEAEARAPWSSQRAYAAAHAKAAAITR
jgi:hypothetical protein